MSTVDYTLTIAAPAAVVFGVLTDFAGYARWNKSVVYESGEARLGGEFCGKILWCDGTSSVRCEKITRLVQDAMVEWHYNGRMASFFNASRLQQLRPIQNGRATEYRTTFTCNSYLPTFFTSLEGNMLVYFTEEARALKAESEGLNTGS